MQCTARSALAIFAAMAGFGALPAGQTPQFRSGIELVEVDVSVLDRNRRPVRGLTKLDFMVLEDGQPREIVSFSEIDVPDPLDVPTPWMRDVAPDVKTNLAGSDRLVVLVLDDAQVRARPAMTDAVKAIGRRVIDRLGPRDLAAVVFTRDNRGAQPFTADRARLLAAVHAFRAGFSGASGPGDWSAEYFYQSSLQTLRYVAETLAGAEQRRKAVIYVSPGIPIDAGQPGQSSRLRSDASQLFREAQRANVNIYGIDPSGLGALDAEDVESVGLTADDSGRVQSRNNEFLQMLASNTGGLAIVNRNEFAEGVTQIFRENGSYYLIGYRSSGEGRPGQYRRIDVRVYRPGLIVRARSGYHGQERDPAAGNVSAALRKAFAAVVPEQDVAMQATAAPFAIPGKKESALALVLAVREPAPPPGEARVRNTVDVLVGAWGPDGRRARSHRLSVTLQLRPESGPTLQYEVLSEMRLPPGRYQLRFAAESSLHKKSGSVYYDVDVPDFSKDALSLSGIVLAATPSVASAPRDLLAKLIPVVPTSRRQFWQTDRVEAFLRVYQPGRRQAGEVLVTTKIRDSSDTTVFETTDPIAASLFGRERSADHRVELPIDRLAEGPYVLTIEAAADGATSRQDVRFVVQ